MKIMTEKAYRESVEKEISNLRREKDREKEIAALWDAIWQLGGAVEAIKKGPTPFEKCQTPVYTMNANED